MRAIFAGSAALAVDQAILFGSGASNQPLGIAGTSGIQVVSMGTNGAQIGGGGPSFDPILNAVLALEAANAGNITALVMAPRTARAIYGAVDGVGQPLNLPPRIAGIPILTTTSMPITETQGSATNASSIILGDFSQVFVGMRTELQIGVLQEKYADNGQVGFVLWPPCRRRTRPSGQRWRGSLVVTP